MERFSFARTIESDKIRLNITWIKEISLTGLDNLLYSDVLAEEIIENLQSGIESFKYIMLGLNK